MTRLLLRAAALSAALLATACYQGPQGPGCPLSKTGGRGATLHVNMAYGNVAVATDQPFAPCTRVGEETSCIVGGPSVIRVVTGKKVTVYDVPAHRRGTVSVSRGLVRCVLGSY